MKVDTSFFINPSVLSNKNRKSNISFREELKEVNMVPKDTIYVDILDRMFRFKLVDEAEEPKVLDDMIENIKKTETGFFIKSNGHEYYTPHILPIIPNIKTQHRVVKIGNAETEINEESEAALKIIESQANEKFDIKNLKTIKYLRKIFNGYANSTVKKAYSYYDKLNDDLYLYIPQKNKMQIMINDRLVKNIKL